MSENLLGILGTLILLGLAINAFFIRDLVEKLTQVRIGVGAIVEKSFATEKRIDSAENNQKDIFKRIYALEIKDRK